jgi:hypothetical protein
MSVEVPGRERLLYGASRAQLMATAPEAHGGGARGRGRHLMLGMHR